MKIKIMSENIQNLDKQLAQAQLEYNLARNLKQATATYKAHSTEENWQAVIHAKDLLKFAQLKETLTLHLNGEGEKLRNTGNYLPHVVTDLLEQALATLDAHLRQPDDGNTYTPETNREASGRDTLPSRLVLRLSGFSAGMVIFLLAIIAPQAVPFFGNLPPWANWGLMAFTLTAFLPSVSQVLEQDIDSVYSQPVTRVTRLSLGLLASTVLFLFSRILSVASTLLSVPVTTPTIIQPSFTLVPFSFVALVAASIVLYNRLRNPATRQSSIKYGLLILLGGTILMTGLMRWLAFSFINLASYPEAVTSGVMTTLLQSGAVDTAVLAHGLIMATFLAFLTCVMVLFDYIANSSLSFFTIVMTIVNAAYAGLLTLANQSMLSSPSTVSMLGDATYIQGEFAHPLIDLLAFIYLFGLVYVLWKALRYWRDYHTETTNLFRLVLAWLIVAFGVVELVALLFPDQGIAGTPLQNFPSAELMLTAGIALIMLELINGTKRRKSKPFSAQHHS